MTIREMMPGDINELRIIHAKFFRHEFDFPNFLLQFHGAFVIEDDENNIVLAGGVRPIAEAITITNGDIPLKTRIAALNKVLDASEFISRRYNYDQLHAFVQNPAWISHLQTVGFAPTKGIALYKNL